MVFNLTHSQIILRYKENGRWSEPYYSNDGEKYSNATEEYPINAKKYKKLSGQKEKADAILQKLEQLK
jgi:hypothetical protein